MLTNNVKVGRVFTNVLRFIRILPVDWSGYYINTLLTISFLWNGSNWSALGSGMNERVYALAISGNELYAGAISPGQAERFQFAPARAYLERPSLSILRSGGRLKNGPNKLAIAARLRDEITLTIKAIAKLHLGTAKSAKLVHRVSNIVQ